MTGKRTREKTMPLVTQLVRGRSRLRGLDRKIARIDDFNMRLLVDWARHAIEAEAAFDGSEKPKT